MVAAVTIRKLFTCELLTGFFDLHSMNKLHMFEALLELRATHPPDSTSHKHPYVLDTITPCGRKVDSDEAGILNL